MKDTFLEYKMRLLQFITTHRKPDTAIMMLMVNDAAPPVQASVRNLVYQPTPRAILLVISHLMQSFKKLNHDYGFMDVEGFDEVHAAFNKLFQVQPKDHRRIE